MAGSRVPKETDLIKAVQHLQKRIDALSAHLETGRFLWMGFLRGIVYGLGILVSFAIVAPILLALLSTIDWIPFIGDIITEVIRRLEETRAGF